MTVFSRMLFNAVLGYLLKLCRLIFGCTKKKLSVQLFLGNLSIFKFIRDFLAIS